MNEIIGHEEDTEGWYLLRHKGQTKWMLVWSTAECRARLDYEARGPFASHREAKEAAYTDGTGLVGDTDQWPSGGGSGSRSKLQG